MTERSDDVFERANQASLRLDPEAKSFRLTGFHGRDTLQLIVGVASSLIVLTGINLACAAVFTKNLLIDKDCPDRQQELQVIQEAVAHSEALLQALREDDQDALERCRKKLDESVEFQKQLRVREAQRLADHALAEKALRKRYGAAAAGLICAGLSLAFFSRRRPRRGNGRSAEPADAVRSR